MYSCTMHTNICFFLVQLRYICRPDVQTTIKAPNRYAWHFKSLQYYLTLKHATHTHTQTVHLQAMCCSFAPWTCDRKNRNNMWRRLNKCREGVILKVRQIQMEGRKGRAVIAAIQESRSRASFDAIGIFRYTENHYKYQNLTAGAFKVLGQPQTKVWVPFPSGGCFSFLSLWSALCIFFPSLNIKALNKYSLIGGTINNAKKSSHWEFVGLLVQKKITLCPPFAFCTTGSQGRDVKCKQAIIWWEKKIDRKKIFWGRQDKAKIMG